jgi:predicted nucleic acid-binding protein
MAYLLDTNVISEFRKGPGANWGVRKFFSVTASDSLFIPVQVIGEIHAGIVRIARCGQWAKADIYGRWLDSVLVDYGDRIIDFDRHSAQMWGELLSHQKKDPHTIDKQIAAMALVSGLTVVTRDKGVAFANVPLLKILNPLHDGP